MTTRFSVAAAGMRPHVRGDRRYANFPAHTRIGPTAGDHNQHTDSFRPLPTLRSHQGTISTSHLNSLASGDRHGDPDPHPHVNQVHRR